MRNPYEARDPGDTGWHDGTGQRNGRAPRAAEPGPDHTLPRRPSLGEGGRQAAGGRGSLGEGGPGAPQEIVSLGYTMPQHAPPPRDRDHTLPPRREPGYAPPSDGGLDAGHTAPAVGRQVPPASGEMDGGRPAPRDDDAAAPPPAHVEVEPAVPAGQQIRDSLGSVASTVRRSIPLRTVLFLLPPLALPALAFDLSVIATLLVALTLLWLAAASAVFCTMMLEGNQQLAMGSVDDRVATGGDGDDLQEALLAIGAQLDRLSDAVAALEGAPAAGTAPPAGPAPSRASEPDDDLHILAPRSHEQWPAPPGDGRYDDYDRTASPDTGWRESRWSR